MISIAGKYHNGCVEFDKEFISDKPVRVIVTFLEDVEVKTEKRLLLSDFNFAKSQENLKKFKGSLSEAIIEERRGGE